MHRQQLVSVFWSFVLHAESLTSQIALHSVHNVENS